MNFSNAPKGQRERPVFHSRLAASRCFQTFAGPGRRGALAGAAHAFTDTGRAHCKGQESLRHGHDPQQPAPHTPDTTRGSPDSKALEQHVKYFRRELKVCEGCGGLWVRTGTEAGVYCRHCCALLADLPGRRKHSPGRPCKVHGRPATTLHVVHAAAPENEGALRGRCRRASPENDVEAEHVAAARRAGMRLHQGGQAVPAKTNTDAQSTAPAEGSSPIPAIERPRAVSAVPMIYAVAGGAR